MACTRSAQNTVLLDRVPSLGMDVSTCTHVKVITAYKCFNRIYSPLFFWIFSNMALKGELDGVRKPLCCCLPLPHLTGILAGTELAEKALPVSNSANLEYLRLKVRPGSHEYLKKSLSIAA